MEGSLKAYLVLSATGFASVASQCQEWAEVKLPGDKSLALEFQKIFGLGLINREA